MSDQRPFADRWSSGSGVQVQRKKVPMSDQRPFTRATGEGGQGVQRQRDPDDVGPYLVGKLASPFPYFGGKSRWIDTVFQRIGKVGVWSEPCCGTAVMTLNNPFPAPREVICDLNAYICNFYRSLRADPDAVAYWADWPTNHHDLTARHRWLLAQGPELRERMVADPDDYDPKIAGWWVWGQSSWIGHGWCDNHGQYDRQPHINTGGGFGVQQQREDLAKQQRVEDKRPYCGGTNGQGRGVQQQRVEDKRPKVPDGGGSGVSAQRDRVPVDKVPRVPCNGGGKGVQQQRDQIPRCTTEPGGQGVSMQRVAAGGPATWDRAPRVHQSFTGQGVQIQRVVAGGDPLTGERLRPWFRAIAERLARVIILNRGWESALTDSVLQQTPSSPKPSVGVFLDPPYRTQRKDGGKRSTGLYQGDTTAASDDVAAATYAWAVEHGERYRVAYCMHEGDFAIPPGWTAETMGFSGHRDASKKEKAVDQVIFSPACVPVATDPQLDLFG